MRVKRIVCLSARLFLSGGDKMVIKCCCHLSRNRNLRVTETMVLFMVNMGMKRSSWILS